MSSKPRDKAADERDERRLREAEARRTRCNKCGYLICSCKKEAEAAPADGKEGVT